MHRKLRQNFTTIWVVVLLATTVLYFGWHVVKAGSRPWKPTSIQPSTPSTTVYASLAELCAHVDAVNCPKRIHK